MIFFRTNPITVAAVVSILVAFGPALAEIPPDDLWTEKTVDPWSATGVSSDRVEIKRNTSQLVGKMAIELHARPGPTPVTFSLSLGKPWNLSDADQLVFAWRLLEGSARANAHPQVTVWARNEIGEGFSRYGSLPIDPKWQHLRLDLNDPDEADSLYGKASRRGVQRIDFTLPAADAPIRILVDDLHFETSAVLVLERARALGPLAENIRPQRYAKFLCGDHLPSSQRPRLEAMYAPQSPIPITPHRKWAKPLADGPLRVLFVVNLAFQREIVELDQRLDMDYDFVPLLLVQRYKTEMLADVARNRYDVIVTSALNPNAQMQPFCDWLSKQVEQGTGWIAINSSGRCGDIDLPFAPDNRDVAVNEDWKKVTDHPVLDGVSLAGFPKFRSRRYEAAGKDETVVIRNGTRVKLAVRTHGKGRVVNLTSGQGNSGFSILPMPNGRTHVRQNHPYWEHEYAMLAKAMVWAAGRTPVLRVRPTGELTFKRGADDAALLALAADRNFAGTIESAWQRLDGARVDASKTRLALVAGVEKPLKIPVPRDLARGVNLLDLVIRDAAGAVAWWGTFACTAYQGPAIEKIDGVRDDLYRRGETIAFNVRVKDPSPSDGRILVEIRDSWDRTIFQHEQAIASTVSLKVDIDDRFLADVHRLKVTVFDEYGVADFRARRLYTPAHPAKKHETWWVGGTAGGSNLHPHLYRHVADAVRGADISTIMTNSSYQADQAELIVDAGLWVTPENIIWTGHWNQRFPEGIRKPCLSDPKVQRENRDRTIEFANAFRRFGPIGYASMEEHSLCTSRPDGTVCLGPFCRARFIEWLRTRYDDLAALNAQWDTDHAAWDAVEPQRWQDGADGIENPSPWIDFRTFMETVYTGMQSRFNESIRKADPGAYVGYNCGIYGENPFAGFNRVRMGRVSDFSIEYQPSWLEDRGVGTTMELLLDTSPQVRAGYWVGYKYMNFDGPRYWFKAWWMALRQQYGPFYYTVNNDASTFADYAYTKFHNTLADNGFTKQIRPTTHALARGLGKLLLNVTRRVDIAVYHSQTSLMRRYYETNRFEQDVKLGMWDVRKLIREAGLDYRRLVEHQLVAGTTSDIKVILLPDCVALSDAEWKGFERFVETGGTLIGFARTGIADGHGSLRTDPQALGRLFGVRHRQEAFRWREDRLAGTEGEGFSLIGGAVVASTPVDAAGATVAAVFEHGEAAVLRHGFGRGRAIYCNFSDHLEPTDENIDMLSAFLDHANVDRRFAIEQEGRPARGFQSFYYDRGMIELFGLLQTMGSAQKPGTELALKLAKPGHLYDVLRGEYLGITDSATFAAAGHGRPAVIARLPYAVDRVVIDGVQTAGRGEHCPITIDIHADHGPVGDHVVRLEVFDPDGRRVSLYTRNVVAACGRFEGVLPFAYNDARGTWTLTARDVVSGATSTRTVELTATGVERK